jgi:hypothetical protein
MSVESIKELEDELSAARAAAEGFLLACRVDSDSVVLGVVPQKLLDEARDVSNQFHRPLVLIAAHMRRSPMFGDADMQAVQRAVRRIDAALRVRLCQEWGMEVLHDEGMVLGVRPAGFSEDNPLLPEDALSEIDNALDQVSRRLSVLKAEAEVSGDLGDGNRTTTAGQVPVRPGTAFIMMMMDAARPDLEDVKTTIQEEFARVGVRAIRADDIEHSGEITHQILEEIRNAEFLIADLSGERPSVYYEIGYAHAIGKRVILYRKKGAPLHFDLAVHNCPEYANLTELREKLRKRLATMTNRDE